MTAMSAIQRLQLRSRARLPMLMQAEAAECGLACLGMVLSYYGHQVDLNSLRRRLSTSLKGVTLLDIANMGRTLGLSSRGVRVEPEELQYLRTPAILHWDMNHFVVLARATGDRAVIHDPGRGVRRCTIAEVGRHFTGVALELVPTAEFERKSEVQRLPMRALLGRIHGLGPVLGQALLLSVLLQIFVLAGPLYMQLAVDQAVARGDNGLLRALALGFGLLALLSLGAEWLRGRVLLALNGVMSFQTVANLFHHLVRLPLSWFEKRHIGDLVSRFGSTRPINDLISRDLVAVVVDGAMAALTLVMIFVYSVSLAAIVLVAVLLNAALRLTTFRFVRARQEEVIDASAKEQTTFMESARAMQAIKLFNRERDREEFWQNRLVTAVNHAQGLGRIQIDILFFVGLVYAVENVLVIYFGAKLVLSTDMTIGMLFAFVAYKMQLVDKATRLLETVVQFRMLDLHLERISDIALSEPEEGVDEVPLVPRPIEGGLELRDISFRYSDWEDWIFQGIDLKVEPREFVAITGPSGQGKTTLLKLMLGLLDPLSGEVLIDGSSLRQLGPAAYRGQVAAVMQDDMLLTGSLAENISFFDASVNLDWLRECGRLAGIDEEVMAMPMNYNTLVGDLGTGLSGGQKQRIMLARALYRRPRILFMDEGTSHLDVAKEREVNAGLKELEMTRIIIAHRPETVAAADRVLVLKEGRLRANSTHLHGKL